MEDHKEKQYKKFKKLDEAWRNDMLGRTEEEVRKVITDAAMNLVTLETAKQFDEDLARLKEELATANEIYKEGKKSNLLKIEFLIEALRSRGCDVPGIEDFVKGAKKSNNDNL